MNDFIKTMNNTTETENGALTNKSTFNGCLDWFFHGAALRHQDENRIIDLFSKAFEEDPQTALRTLFYIRDCRGGQGEREIFRKCLVWLANNQTVWLIGNLDLISIYGRYDDYLCLLDTEINQVVATYLISIMLKDIHHVEFNESFSLCAKWMPSLTSSKTVRKQAKTLINLANKSGSFQNPINEATYRKMVSKLRKAIKIVEHNLTNRDYDSIDYSKVPSYASLKYRSAFKRNDYEHYNKYLEDVKSGKVKINTGTLYPYDLVSKYPVHCGLWDQKIPLDQTVEEQWKALPDYVPEINGLVVYDTSGSMSGLPMDVSMSLALYISERNKSEIWRNYCIPFSSKAEWKEVKGDTLLDKLHSIYTGDCSNTNLQSVFDLILGRAVAFKVKPEDMPKVLLIITDMEFDYVDNIFGRTSTFSTTNFKVIEEKYKEAGYERPNLVWWNVQSRNTQTPVTKDDNGNILISGCSPSVLKVALSGEFDPIEAMNRVVNQERYEQIKF